MLEVAAKTLLLESGPDDVLVHAVGLSSPLGKSISVERDFLLEVRNGGAVDEEEDLQHFAISHYSKPAVRIRDTHSNTKRGFR